MKIKNKKLKILFRLLIFIVIIPALIIIFISPVTKYLVQKYDTKYTGREIEMSWAYVNPFTGYIYFSGLKIYESKSDSLFLSTSGLSMNFSVTKLFSQTCEISELVFEDPKGLITQTGTQLNLDDLIEKFSSDKDSLVRKAPIKFSILSIRIKNGEIEYRETITPVSISIIDLNLESSGVQWNCDTIATKFSFRSGTGHGDIKGNFTINTKNLDYHFNTIVNKLDLHFINQYLKDLVHYGVFKASLDADVIASGNFNAAQNLDAKGKVMLNEFHFGKDSLEDYASFDKLVVDVRRLNPGHHLYLFDSLLLMHPYFKYETYDHLDNVQTMFGEKGGLVSAAQNNPQKFNLVLEIGKYIRILSTNFFSSNYEIKRLALTNGDVHFSDFSKNEEFSIAACPLNITSDSIDKNHKRVNLSFQTGILPYGKASMFLSINPKDSSDFDMTYAFEKLPVTLFNAYLVSYTSFPLDRGTIELNGKWNVQNGFIQSTNHLIVIDPRVSKRIRKKDSKWLPLPLIMAFVRERGNVIDYEIPITGNIKSPDFKLKDVLMDLLRNIFVKPPTTPYRMEVRNTESEVEKSLGIKWEMRQNSLQKQQVKFVSAMADFLRDNPGASISIHPVEYGDKEKECILFFEAKKKYYLAANAKKGSAFSENDSIAVDKIQIKDSAFIKFLDNYCSDSMLFTVQQKCYRYVGEAFVNTKYDQLMNDRENAFRYYFRQNGTDSRVKFSTAQVHTPYNGFSNYEINYNGQIPETLSRAFAHLQKLNEEAPRIRYFKLRKKDAPNKS